jgi:hypothetical protein
MESGNGRVGNQWTREELSERLTELGVPHTTEELAESLARLADVDLLRWTQRQGYSRRFVRRGVRRPDHIDQLAMDVCDTLKRRDKRAASDEQLALMLNEDGVSYAPKDLGEALYELERIGRLRTPRADHWREDLPLPLTYVPPKVFP